MLGLKKSTHLYVATLILTDFSYSFSTPDVKLTFVSPLHQANSFERVLPKFLFKICRDHGKKFL